MNSQKTEKCHRCKLISKTSNSMHATISKVATPLYNSFIICPKEIRKLNKFCKCRVETVNNNTMIDSLWDILNQNFWSFIVLILHVLIDEKHIFLKQILFYSAFQTLINAFRILILSRSMDRIPSLHSSLLIKRSVVISFTNKSLGMITISIIPLSVVEQIYTFL